MQESALRCLIYYTNESLCLNVKASLRSCSFVNDNGICVKQEAQEMKHLILMKKL